MSRLIWEQSNSAERDAWFVEHVFGIPVLASWTAAERNDPELPYAVYDRRTIKDACEGVRVQHPDGILGGGELFTPTRKIEHAIQLEKKIREQALGGRYAQLLWHAIFPTEDFSWEKVFAAINAPPEQRSLAAFLAFSELNSKGARR